MKKLVLLSSCLFIASSASFANNLAKNKLSIHNIKKNTKSLKSEEDVENPRLGYGYDNHTGLAMAANCLANYNGPNAIEYSNPIVNIITAIDEMSLINYLNINGHNGFETTFFSNSSYAKYAKLNRETRNSISFNYAQEMSYQANYKLPGVGIDALSSYAKNQLLNMGNDIFIETCGNSYVNQARVGAVLVISAKIEFASNAQKTDFEKSASAKITGPLSVSDIFVKEKNSSTKNAILKISAIQLGGDSSKLADAFGVPKSDEYYIVTCTTETISDCTKTINKFFDYLVNDFSKSIDFANPKTGKNYYTYNINTMQYKQIGVPVTLPDLTDDAIKAKEYLSNQVKQDIEIYNYLLRYKNQAFTNNFMPRTKDALDKAISNYNEINKMYYENNIIYACYGSGVKVNKNCVNVAEAIRSLHNNYKNSIETAHKFASTYLIMSGMDRTMALFLVGASDWNFQGYSTFTGGGAYALITPNSNLICNVDTTADNSYAKQWDPSLIGYFFICPDANTAFSTYGKRITVKLPFEDKPQDFVIFGYWKDGIQYDYPVNQYGFNGYVLYSDETTWKYNEI